MSGNTLQETGLQLPAAREGKPHQITIQCLPSPQLQHPETGSQVWEEAEVQEHLQRLT